MALLYFLFLISLNTQATCFDKLSEIGNTNVTLEFSWERNNESYVECYKEEDQIGSCSTKCFPVPKYAGIYRLSATLDVRKVNLTIVTFTQSMSGTYSCTLINSYERKTTVIQERVLLTALTLYPTTPETYPVLNEQSTFSCVTSQSKPGASIQWFLDGKNITELAMYKYNTSAYVASSLLSYRPNASTDRQLTCVAMYVFSTTNNTISKTTQLRVQVPVTQPVITMNNAIVLNMVAVREGRQVNFNCLSAGSPTPSYQWNTPGGTSDKQEVVLHFNRTSKGNVSCLARNTFYSLDGSLTKHTSELKSTVELNVLYSPTNLKLTGIYQDRLFPLNDTNLRLVRGDNFSITCECEANPFATVSWQGLQANSSTIIVTKIQHETDWTCHAYNVMLETDGETTMGNLNSTLTSSVLYAPTIPTIEYTIEAGVSAVRSAPENASITVIEGRDLQLICYTKSNPLAKLSWGLGHEGSIRSITNITRTSVTQYTCVAENLMNSTYHGSITGRSNSSVHLNILYGPRNMSATYNNTTNIDKVLRVIKGWYFTITCYASSRPDAIISWNVPDYKGGNQLFITNVDTSKNITCLAMTTMSDSFGHSVNMSATLTIAVDVQYPAAIQPIHNQSVLINGSVSVQCNLSNAGKPRASNFTWTQIDNKAIRSTYQNLTIDRVQTTDEGVYMCNAINTMETIGDNIVYGKSQSKFYLDVQYGASVERFYAKITNNTTIAVNQGQSVELICVADGDPEPVIRIVNKTAEHDTLLLESPGFNVTTQINHSRCEYDAGVYKCQAKNIHNTTSKEQLLNVAILCSPRVSPFSPPNTTLYKAPNDTAVLTFTIKAYPKPNVTNFTWYKNTSVDKGWKVISNSSKYRITVSEDLMRTALSILQVDVGDFGQYQVNVSNQIGYTAQLFAIHAKPGPDAPTHLLASQISETVLIVEWTPGFDGYEDQTFTIRYTEVGMERWEDIHVPSNDLSYQTTIKGLKSRTTYKIKIQAKNKIGVSHWSEEIQVTTLGEQEKSSSSPVVGGVIGGVIVALIIGVVVAAMIWRYRKRGSKETALKTSDSKHILGRRSNIPERTEYENIGMLPTHQENKTEERKDSPSSEVINYFRNKKPPLTNNNQGSMKHAEEPMTDKDGIQCAPLQPKIQHSQKRVVTADILQSPLTPSKEKPTLQRRDSFSVERDPIYDNLYKKKEQFKSRSISVQNLRDTVVQDKDNKTDVFTEYSALNVASEKIAYSTNAATKPNNISKNRYKRMYPYDKNRVTLTVVGNDTDTDFINASFIDGHTSPRTYLAAQGPLAVTIADFWRMIWEHNSQIVIMVTNLIEELKKKCVQYWPNDSENNSQFSDMTVQLVAVDTYADFTIRTLRCTKADSTKHRMVTQFHFTAWPDKDVPDTALSLKQFWRKVRSMEIPDQSPWIVHCSAGVGRTGTFIALDYLYDKGVSEKQINVFDCVRLLREQRINMVQTKNQYLYLHEVLCEALCPVGDILTNKHYIDNKRSPDSLNQEYHNMCQSHIPDREEGETDGVYITIASGETPENLNKNFDPCIVPDDKYRPLLHVNIIAKGHNDYINAVYISTFREKNKLILTQSAQTSSDLDFLRLLHEHYVKTVITLCDEVEPYIPEGGRNLVIGPYTASLVSNAQKQNFQEFVVRFKHIGENEYFDVQILRFTQWSSQYDVCKTRDLLCLLSDVQENTSSEGTVVIQCRDGYSRSGLVAVLWCLMERSKRDGEVAVAETVRVIRRRREQVIKNEAQYRFCHEFMKEYIQGCLVYANT